MSSMVPIVKLLSLASAKHCGSGLESNEQTELTCQHKQEEKGKFSLIGMCKRPSTGRALGRSVRHDNVRQDNTPEYNPTRYTPRPC